MKNTEEKYLPTYWNNKGKYQKEYEDISRDFIPASGSCDLMAAELIRCLTDIYHDVYNNGAFNLDTDYFKYELGFVTVNLPADFRDAWDHIVKMVTAEGFYGSKGLSDKDAKTLDEIIDQAVLYSHAKLMA
jgi:hypothetical protein